MRCTFVVCISPCRHRRRIRTIIFGEGQTSYFGPEARPDRPKPEARRVESGVEFLKRGSQPPPRKLGGLGTTVSSPSGR